MGRKSRKKQKEESESEDSFTDSEEEVKPKKTRGRPKKNQKNKDSEDVEPEPEDIDDWTQLPIESLREELKKRNYYPPMVEFFDRHQLIMILNEKPSDSFQLPSETRSFNVMMQHGILSKLNTQLLNHSLTQSQISTLPEDTKNQINLAYNSGITTDEIISKYIKPVLKK
ncbi:hypothetical protein TVAG_205020 [Trichomonas vaginalis G3]|uniref:Uncharacterized protein n=1 Tax=Trichomonas vaginalis (strain ATCC PRA-98 / G3) TaxID=412133 RepID=A2EJ04_TRIV3|nr:hypothetical protein TVAGG3_0661800 [Trichomonas vaginalis G3]EAY07394.1 hypothetical protein TVAG_205020 [Trichomonas vaginalis G3]KAI5506547.1 hypothetical protein TVAGG3_0661800 [Trichomonas vaginalis G3]|eukprot:XP_001319617.1 hypothetical protein [Trichomonas vaginalis G3]